MTRFSKCVNVVFQSALMILFAASAASYAENKRDASYADYLYSKGFYAESRSEYLFQSFASGTPAERDRYLYKASKSLLESGNFRGAEKELYAMFTANETPLSVKNAARFDYLRSLYFQKYHMKIDSECASWQDKAPREEMVLLWSYLADGNWNGAESVSRRLSENPNAPAVFSAEEADRFKRASQLISKRPDFNEKSTVLAASLSAIFPGAGHLYAGSFTNAFGSFILNSVFISLTAYSWHIKNYPAAALCGFLEVGWYAGNIVSAYQNAALVNAAAERRYTKRVLDSFPYELGYSYAF